MHKQGDGRRHIQTHTHAHAHAQAAIHHQQISLCKEQICFGFLHIFFLSRPSCCHSAQEGQKNEKRLHKVSAYVHTMQITFSFRTARHMGDNWCRQLVQTNKHKRSGIWNHIFRVAMSRERARACKRAHGNSHIHSRRNKHALSDIAPTNKICRRASNEQRPRTRSCHQ